MQSLMQNGMVEKHVIVIILQYKGLPDKYNVSFSTTGLLKISYCKNSGSAKKAKLYGSD